MFQPSDTALIEKVSPFRDHAECVRLLLKAGADPKVKGANGWTALHAAMYHNNIDVARLLIRSGADPEEVPLRNIATLEAIGVEELERRWCELLGDPKQK